MDEYRCGVRKAVEGYNLRIAERTSNLDKLHKNCKDRPKRNK